MAQQLYTTHLGTFLIKGCPETGYTVTYPSGKRLVLPPWSSITDFKKLLATKVHPW